MFISMAQGLTSFLEFETSVPYGHVGSEKACCFSDC